MLTFVLHLPPRLCLLHSYASISLLPQRMDFGPLRNYLAQPPRASGTEVVRDAVLLQVPGAVELLNLVLQVRVNRRTRRTLAHVVAIYNAAVQPRWYGQLCQHLWNLYRLFICQGSPENNLLWTLYVTFSRNYDCRFNPSPFKPSFTMCQCFLILAFPQFDLLLDYDSEEYIINLDVLYLF